MVVDFGSVTVGGVKPALGRTWTYVPSTHIMLSQQESESVSVRLATVVKSSQQVCTTKHRVSELSISRDGSDILTYTKSLRKLEMIKSSICDFLGNYSICCL